MPFYSHPPDEVLTNTVSCWGIKRVNALQLKRITVCEILKKGKIRGSRSHGGAPERAERMTGHAWKVRGRGEGFPSPPRGAESPAAGQARHLAARQSRGSEAANFPGAGWPEALSGSAPGSGRNHPSEDVTRQGLREPVALLGPALSPGKHLRTRR